MQEIRKKMLAARNPEEFFCELKKMLKEMSLEENGSAVSGIVDRVLEKEEIQDLEAKEILSERFLEQIASLTSAFAWSVKKEGFSRGNLFLWDLLFLKQLSTLGEHGVERTKQVKERLQESFSAYYKDERGDRLSRYWVNKEEGGRIFQSPIFLVLGEVIWLDVAKSSWMRKKKMSQLYQKAYGFLQLKLSWEPKKR